jgi:UDP-galactopyranose mutase
MKNLERTLVCFSHLRWNFVYQRPQHLMSRFANIMQVIFFEEPVFGDSLSLEVTHPNKNISVAVPHLPKGLTEWEVNQFQKEFVSRLLIDSHIDDYLGWYYTPMALRFTDHLDPTLTVYDCMDELTAFKFAPQALRDLEKELLEKADVVFTGGYSLYEAKKHQHHSIHPFSSSIDYDHFAKARSIVEDPADQRSIPHPRFGFYGVIDERMDLILIREVARQRSDWHFVLIGPVVKIDEADLPRLPNIHYLGMKKYEGLPSYLAGWDFAFMPFAINEATRFISPTKTPEFLAAGKPVISTPINDVIRQYADVIHFAATPTDFISVAENDIVEDAAWLNKVDIVLRENSWDKTWQKMNEIILKTLDGDQEHFYNTEKKQNYV